MNLALQFVRSESGQDMVEWALLIAFITLCSGALFYHNAAAIESIWNHNVEHLESANAAAN